MIINTIESLVDHDQSENAHGNMCIRLISYVLPHTVSITLPAASWDATAKTQTVTVTGVTADNAVTPTPAPASWEAAGQAGVRCTAQAANSLAFTCTTVPTVDLTYNVLIQEVQ